MTASAVPAVPVCRPFLVVDRQTLPLGLVAIFGIDPERVRMTYDPARMSALDVRQLLAVHTAYTEGPVLDVMRGRAVASVGGEREWYELLFAAFDHTGDPAGVARRVLQLIRRERAASGGGS